MGPLQGRPSDTPDTESKVTQGLHTEHTFEAELEAHLRAHGYEPAFSNDFERDPRKKRDFSGEWE